MPDRDSDCAYLRNRNKAENLDRPHRLKIDFVQMT